MNIRIVYLLVISLFGNTAFAQNIPNTLGLPTDALNGLVTYPTNYNASPNVNPTFYNYQRVYRPLAPMQSIPAFSSTGSLPILVNTVYKDGLGNNMMTIDRTNTGDVITPMYNRVSKTSVSFLPYATAHNQKIQLGCYTTQKSVYQSLYSAEGATAYSKTVNSSDPVTGTPVVKSYAPGKAYVGQSRGTTQKVQIYSTNDIFIFKKQNNTICKTGTFVAGALLVKTENDYEKEVFSYKDKSDRLVCKMQINAQNAKEYTYYIYDDLGNLVYVATPLAVKQFISNPSLTCLDTNILKSLCYSYVYDEYGNVIEKGTPGKQGKEYIVYDRLHRPVMTQTPLMAAQDNWNFTVYDNRGRVAMSGIANALLSAGYNRQWFQQAIRSSQNQAQGSVVNAFRNPISAPYPSSFSNCDIQLINYYDDYATLPSPQTSYNNTYAAEFLTDPNMEIPQPYNFVNGRLVGSRQKILNPNSVPGNFDKSWITNVYYYDDKGRVIQAQTLNPWKTHATLTQWDIVALQYDFSNNVVFSIRKHHAWTQCNKPKTEIRLRNVYNDQTGRLEEVKQQMDSEPWQVIQKYDYDVFGRATHKWIGGTEEQNYTYAIDGKTIGINNSYINSPTAAFPPTMTFAETVSFEQGFSLRRYDGNVSGFKWRTGGGKVSAYGYDYDTMGQITKADFREYITPGNTWSKTSRDFSVSNITYDGNGNMKSMNQYGYNNSFQPTLIDSFNYSYSSNSNQIASVTDNGNDSPIDDFNNYGGTNKTANYTYDENGNLASDDLKGISMLYNQRDQPQQVYKISGDTIKNVYDATGNLREKRIKAGSAVQTYYYWGPFVYRNDSLLYVLQPEGRCRWVADTAVFRYDYFIKDHLGNVRTVVTTDAQSLSHYYLATHEVASANIEEQVFDNIADVRSPNPESEEGNMEAVRLNGGESDRRIGTSLLVNVMAGDKVNLQGYSYHEGKDGGIDDFTVPEQMLSSLVSTLTDGVGGFEGAETENPDFLNNMFGEGSSYANLYDNIKQQYTNPDHPRAYLNYLFFDKDFNLREDVSGIIQVSGNANTWEQISTPDIPIKETGYLLVYICNEQAQNVWFDNIAITYTKGRLLEENHYYPHGLLVKGTTTPGVIPNKYKHQHKLLQDELGMQLYDFHARQYDAQIGRFWGVDPMDQFASGYVGMGNNPANMIDPSGMHAWGLFEPPHSPSAEPSIWDEVHIYVDGFYMGSVNMGNNGPGPGPFGGGSEGFAIQSALMGGGDYNVVSITTFTEGDRQSFVGDKGKQWVTGSSDGYYGADGVYVAGTQTFHYQDKGSVYMGSIQLPDMSSSSSNVVSKANEYYGYGSFLPSLVLGLAQSDFGKSMANGGVALKNLSDAAKSELGLTTKTMTGWGNKLGIAGLALTGIDMTVNGPNGNNFFDASFSGASFVPVFGWAIGGVYFIGNEGSKAYSGKSIGQHYDAHFIYIGNGAIMYIK